MKYNGSSLRTRKPVGLALQGAGSWGAYTWGVLDALLASRSLAIGQLSGTSAGAINAAIVAGALATGSTRRARDALRSFWLDVAYPTHAAPGGEVWAPVERAWRESIGAWLLSSGTSPYQLNPLGINPLRELIARHVDIDALRSGSAKSSSTRASSRKCKRSARCARSRSAAITTLESSTHACIGSGRRRQRS